MATKRETPVLSLTPLISKFSHRRHAINNTVWAWGWNSIIHIASEEGIYQYLILYTIDENKKYHSTTCVFEKITLPIKRATEFLVANHA